MTFKEASDFITKIDMSKVKDIIKVEDKRIIDLCRSTQRTPPSESLQFDKLVVHNTSIEKQRISDWEHCLYYCGNDANYIPSLRKQAIYRWDGYAPLKANSL